jgi:uncharacterized protein
MLKIRRSQRLVCLVFVLALLAWAIPTFAVTVEEIPSPRPDGWSVDLTGTIPAGIRQQIDHLGDEVKAANGAEIAVVVIDSTGGVPSRDFARSLFDYWKIGESDEDNGFLLLAALGDRRVEIVLGRGLDNPANNQVSAEIMQGEIVPLLRAGDPGGALLAGTRAAARRILDVAPPVAESIAPLAELPAEAPPVAESAPAPETTPPAPSGDGETTVARPRPTWNLLITGRPVLLLALVALVAGVGYLALRAPRCRKCQIPMTLLSEKEDDAYLTPIERTEEKLGSINHAIWLCSGCGESRKISRLAPFSGHSHCASCGAKAALSTSWVIVSPTYSSYGERRVDTSCAHCNHQTSYTVAIPRLVETRNDDSDRWSSSSSGSSSAASAAFVASVSSSDTSSSSSDSGSSGYSGGESSGGGASGSW